MWRRSSNEQKPRHLLSTGKVRKVARQKRHDLTNPARSNEASHSSKRPKPTQAPITDIHVRLR